MGSTLDISRSLVARILAEAAATRDEICGLLLGPPRHDEAMIVAEAQSCRNVAPDPACRFEIDPAALIAAHRSARAGGPVIVGHYHSHPSGRAIPSAADAAAAAPDGRIWLIVAGHDVTAWRAVRDGAVEGRFDPLTLAVAD